MTELTEKDKYALFANVPYLINEGVPIDDIERDLKEYGLDYTVDKDLSDKQSATIVGKNDIVHSVRGTDIHSIQDLIIDAGIVTSHPIFIKLFNTALAGTTGIPFLQSIEKTSNIISNALYGMYSGYDLLTSGDWEEGPQMSREEWVEELERLNDRINIIKQRETREQMKRTGLTSLGLLSSALTLTKTKRLLTDNIRIEPEKKKLSAIKQKYPKRDISLTGHSLGSIVNVLGRKEGIKSITFNPAPQETEDIIKAHPASKIYRVEGDPVSYFLTDKDTEKIVTIPKNPYIFTHSLTNFIPPKPDKKLIKEELKEESPKSFIYMKERFREQNERPSFDLCKLYPENPICKRNKVYF